MSRKQAKSSRQRTRVRAGQLTSQASPPAWGFLSDVTSPEFAAEAHRQSLVIANSPYEKEDQAFIDSIYRFNDESGA